MTACGAFHSSPLCYIFKNNDIRKQLVEIVGHVCPVGFFQLGLNTCTVLVLAHTENVLLRHVALLPDLHLSYLTLHAFRNKGGLEGAQPHTAAP